MAKASICDRCGKVFSPPILNNRTYRLYRRGFLIIDDRECDLCGDCYEKLYKWITCHPVRLEVTKEERENNEM